MFSLGTVNQIISSFVLNNKKNNKSTGSSINLKPHPNHSLLFNQSNDLSKDSVIKNPENMTNCKYYDIDDIQKFKLENTLSLFHLNTCSIKKVLTT